MRYLVPIGFYVIPGEILAIRFINNKVHEMCKYVTYFNVQNNIE